jgi:betaine lipid synthase
MSRKHYLHYILIIYFLRIMKFQQDIQYLSLPLRLSVIPFMLISIYIIQLQTKLLDVSSNPTVQSFALYILYGGITIAMLCILAWDKIYPCLKFMYSCFFKPLGNHGNDQQSRLEAFYQDQAKSA